MRGKPGTDAERRSRRQQTNEAAWTAIEEERRLRAAKTERLRTLRLTEQKSRKKADND
jgi:hypothetical protein